MTYPITVFEAKGRDEGGACEKIEASTGIRFRNCDVERQHRFRAAVPSTSHGNLFIERLPFNNRIAILFTGESFEAVSVDVSLNHFTADLALGIGDQGRLEAEPEVPYSGSDLVLTLQGPFSGDFQQFKPGTQLIVVANYVYPSVPILQNHIKIAGRLNKIMLNVLREFTHTSTISELVAAVDEGIDILSILLELDSGMDRLTVRQVEMVQNRLSEAKVSLEQQAPISEVTAQIKEELEQLQHHLSTLKNFIVSEIARLTDEADDISANLQALLETF